MKDMENIFLQSTVNGCEYVEPMYFSRWEWPTGTWFQNRRQRVVERKEQCQAKQEQN